MSRAVGTALERWGRVDVLVNNAVYWGDRMPWEAPLFEELAPEEWRARPDEVAAAIVYLCSGANTAINGEIVRVGGGAT